MSWPQSPLGYAPTEQPPKPPPPQPIEDQREMYFPTRPLRFYPLDLGIAVGLAAALFMLLTMLIALVVNPSGLKLFADIFPGFQLPRQWSGVAEILRSLAQMLLNLFWSFGAGFLLAAVAALIYNYSLRKYILGDRANGGNSR